MLAILAAVVFAVDTILIALDAIALPIGVAVISFGLFLLALAGSPIPWRRAG